MLANDSAGRGALSLVSVEAPAHGTAAVEDGKLRYTPADGFFGSDSLRYTVRAEDSGATASARVALSVQARLTLSGLITDAPIANAAVTLQVGEQRIETSADDQGRYTAEVTSADPAGWVQVSGVSADGRVRLVSVVGELGQVAAAAEADTGAVDAERLPALSATHWTSAEAALRARALSGVLPASAEQMAATDGVVNAAALQTLATAVRLIADGGVALPEGAADSFALLLNDDRTQAFVAAQSTGNAEAFSAAHAAVLADAPAPAGEPWAVTEAHTWAYSDGGNPVSHVDLVLGLGPGGGATVFTNGGAHAASWTATGATLDVALTSPIETAYVDCLEDPVAGGCTQYAAVYRTLGYRLQAMDSGGGVRPAVLVIFTRSVWTEGPKSGEVIRESGDDSGFLATFFDLARREGVQAGELTVGARLAGPVSSDVAPDSGMRRQDILRIDGQGSGTLEISGKAATWSLDEGWLTVTAEGVTPRRYTRLQRDPMTGLESWLAASLPADPSAPVVYYGEADLLFADPGLVFTADNATRRWRSEGFVVAAPEAYSLEPSYVLNADGTATGFVQRWELRADGTLSLFRVRAGQEWPRRWIPLSRVGPHWLVLEIVDYSYASGAPAGSDVLWRVNWLRDLGPAGD